MTVQMPRMRRGSSRAVSEGARSSATRMTGSSGSAGAPCSVPARRRSTRCPTSCRSAARAGHPRVRAPRGGRRRALETTWSHAHAAPWPASISAPTSATRSSSSRSSAWWARKMAASRLAGPRGHGVVDVTQLLACGLERLRQRRGARQPDRSAADPSTTTRAARNWNSGPIATPGAAAIPATAWTAGRRRPRRHVGRRAGAPPRRPGRSRPRRAARRARPRRRARWRGCRAPPRRRRRA